MRRTSARSSGPGFPKLTESKVISDTTLPAKLRLVDQMGSCPLIESAIWISAVFDFLHADWKDACVRVLEAEVD
ncbi:hypothetical protein CC2G_002271 [Coprinopsis cinerea AmutBmut pab1-1]|nr:hypothetical protein CC2G_002271 [Coprinopsis cinerea AmutBmut pab1-1]